MPATNPRTTPDIKDGRDSIIRDFIVSLRKETRWQIILFLKEGFKMKNTGMPLPEIPQGFINDLHNLQFSDNADLVLFMAGNQFMVMEELLATFQRSYPEIKHIFYETLPPGLELKQILAGGARCGDREIKVQPDVYSSVTEDAMKTLKSKGLVDHYFMYLHNRIVLMVPEENPARIETVQDLGRDEVRISQTGELEDISTYILSMYRDAGGEGLVKRIMDEKRAEGTTILTLVHHRETPLRIKKKTVDVGPVWATEVFNAQKQGLKVNAVDPGEKLDQQNNVNYYIAKLEKAQNPENADKFLDFIKSHEAQKIYKNYGFVPHFT
jgi:ABC-type molybdate transport system substrate-binding protein